jgi:hypothetical protein
MAQYDPLREFLNADAVLPLTLSFKQVERILGFSLPATATSRPQWWGNENPQMTQHSHSRAWTELGLKATADLAMRRVTFS